MDLKVSVIKKMMEQVIMKIDHIFWKNDKFGNKNIILLVKISMNETSTTWNTVKVKLTERLKKYMHKTAQRSMKILIF